MKLSSLLHILMFNSRIIIIYIYNYFLYDYLTYMYINLLNVQMGIIIKYEGGNIR